MISRGAVRDRLAGKNVLTSYFTKEDVRVAHAEIICHVFLES
jgi:hypothetical protein